MTLEQAPSLGLHHWPSKLDPSAPLIDCSIIQFSPFERIEPPCQQFKEAEAGGSVQTTSSQSYRRLAERRWRPRRQSGHRLRLHESSIGELLRPAWSGSNGRRPQRRSSLRRQQHHATASRLSPSFHAGPTWPLYPYPHHINVGPRLNIASPRPPCRRGGSGAYI